MQNVACPRCATPRVDSSRYCGCGFDFWRAAEQMGAVARGVRRPVRRRRTTGAVARTLAFAATMLLVLAAVVVTLAALPGQNGGSLLDQLSGGRVSFGRIGQSSALYGGPGIEVVEGFVATATEPDVSFHVDFTGSVSVSDTMGGSYQELTYMTAALDVAGEDWSGFVDAFGVAETVAADVVFKDGRAWARAPGSVEWVPSEFEPTQPVNPFVEVDGAEEVDYLGTALIDGRVLHHLRISKWLGGEVTSLPEDVSVNRTDTSFDVYTTADGVPVYATLTQTLHVNMNGTTGQIETPAEYRFSRWGEPILIETPAITG